MHADDSFDIVINVNEYQGVLNVRWDINSSDFKMVLK